MKHLSPFLGILFIGLLLVLGSCRKDEIFPPEPAIEFVEYFVYPADSGLYRINFTDGDGDIGTDSEDSTKHIFLEYRYLDTLTGTWKKYLVNVVPPVPPATVGDSIYMEFSYRIPEVENVGKDKALKGEINVRIPYPHFLSAHTYFYKCWIYDRAGHKSNVVESQIVYP